ncbi:MAG: trimeric intracellular cation channel family protein [Prevotella sp.]|nr:trimeric intracellular cation channel family protein [Prevotella sp.]
MSITPDYSTFLLIIEFLGTFAFAISGIHMAAAKKFDWFGGYCCGFAVAIGGGTIRDVMLGTTPFWMTNALYIICTGIALLLVIFFEEHVNRIYNAFLHIFDTLGVALFTVVGIQKSLLFGQPYWVAIILGCITGAAGGMIRDILLNEVPLIFRREIYAMASVGGGLVYCGMIRLGFDVHLTSVVTFFVVCVTRLLAVQYHLSLPVLKVKKPHESPE